MPAIAYMNNKTALNITLKTTAIKLQQIRQRFFLYLCLQTRALEQAEQAAHNILFKAQPIYKPLKRFFKRLIILQLDQRCQKKFL